MINNPEEEGDILKRFCNVENSEIKIRPETTQADIKRAQQLSQTMKDWQSKLSKLFLRRKRLPPAA